MTSCSAEKEAPSSLWMAGSATLTIKKSSGGKNAPTSKMTNMAQRRGSACVMRWVDIEHSIGLGRGGNSDTYKVVLELTLLYI